MATTETGSELGRQIVEDAKDYVLYSWSVQNAINPIAVERAEGRYFYDYDGKAYLDFASQLVNVSIGHSHPKVVQAIKDQAEKLATIGPPMATESRSRLGELLGEVAPGALQMWFFTNGGAEANENAIKLARWYTGRHKIIARYRSYHGATGGAITLTGGPRRRAHGGRHTADRVPRPPARGTRNPRRRAHARPVHVPLPRRTSRPVSRLHRR